MKRFRVLKARVPIVPKFWWHVRGRQMFDSSVPTRIKSMWKTGSYN